MVKPRAARKQPIVLSSDSEEDASRPPPSKRPKRSLLTAQTGLTQNDDKPARAPSKSAAASKPPKAASKKSPTKSPSKPKPVYKSITSFFSNVPQPQLSQRAPSPDKPSTPQEDIEDIFDSSDDDSQGKPRTALPVRNQAKTSTVGVIQNGARGRQQFLRTIAGSQGTSVPAQDKPKDAEDRRPWTDKYGPSSLEELAVHKKKVADVRTWLSDVLGGRDRKRLLILKGPAGSGKTTTVNLLSKELSIDIQEWKNPTSSMSTSDGPVSATAQFEDFVGRTGTFGSLSFDGSASSPQPNPVSSQSGKRKQLVLVEEYPNTFTRASSAVQSFRSSVLNYLAANTQSATAFFSSQANPDTSITPIVMIISETLLSTNTAAADSFTAHRLLGPEILTHPGVTVIEFNPIAPTFMTKALETIVVKEARKSGRRKTLGPQVIQRLADLGDIRSAVSSLEFLCLRGDDAEGWGAKVNFSKKKGPKDVPITKMEHESLELITQRESTLGIFHSVGRVVHNKRVPENPDSPVPHPPNWFPERRRPKASEVNVNTLIDELGTDTQTFVAALHENYVLSCGGADSEETMESIEGCIDGLSDADLLSPDRFGAGAGRRNLQGTSADNLRQDEMCFQTSVRGILYSLPNPVKRMAPPPGVMGVKPRGQGSGAPVSKGNAFVMYYPASLRLWRQQEETEGLLEMWISRAQRGELLASLQGAAKSASAPSGIDTWRTKSFAQPASTQRDAQSSDEDSAPTVLLGSGGSARYEMLLERLPYLAIIFRKARNPAPATAATIREIRKITSFTGDSISRTEDDDDDLDDRAQGDQEQWTTDKPTPETPRKKKGKFGVKELEPQSSIPGLVENSTSLALSDDDIED